MNTITPQELHELKLAGRTLALLDVRTPVEYQEMHIEFAQNVPIHRIDSPKIDQLRTHQQKEPIYVICQSGGRSKQACEKLAAAGLETVNVEGGTVAWVAAGLPVLRGQKKVVSLERQVRIAAGSLVLLGSALGYFVHPYFVGLAAFIGAGLVFAGLTNTCGMGLVLARMPWNQAVAPSDAACGLRS